MLIFLAAFLSFVILFHIFIFKKYNWPSYTKIINKIPGPSGIFFFGSSLRFYKLKNEELLYDLINDFKKYGTTYRHWYNGMAVVFVSDLEDVQTILGSRLSNSKGEMYRNILPWLGNGLLTSSGQKWFKMRKIITPTFHFSILQGYIEIFKKNTNLMMKIFEKEAEKEESDLQKFVTNCTLDNVCETAMGTCINALGMGKESKYVQGIFRMGQIVVKRLFSPFLFQDTSFALSSLGWEHRNLLKTLHDFTYKIIEEKKELRNAQKEIQFVIKDDMVEDDKNKKKCSFLEMLLDNQDAYSLTAEDIRMEVDTFMFEGHDTTAASINWTLFELGHNEDVQEQCFSELQKIFGDSNRPATYQDLMEMSYLKRVINEALRLYPSVPVISRQFDVDIKLKNYFIPANTEIVLVLYWIHRNPEVYSNPEKFDPDRFLPQEIENRHPFAYIPFSAGQRNCVGQKFAILEELVVLSSIIRNYKIQSLDSRDSIKVVPEMILRPHKKLRFKITRRIKSSSE